MKKIIFTLLALVGTMSMNAQVTQAFQLMKDGKVVKTYTVEEVDAVVCKEVTIPTTGTATRTGGISVNWVQLWEGGPKFAEYNVGATSATEYGGYYTWGGTYNNNPALEEFIWTDDHTTGKSNLSCTGDIFNPDTATKLWGIKWRMPTSTELEALLDNCTVEWTTDGGVSGRKFTGKGYYKDNSVFLPAAGYCDGGSVGGQGYGHYWSSTADGDNFACNLNFNSGYQGAGVADRYRGYSVRPVLAE